MELRLLRNAIHRVPWRWIRVQGTRHLGSTLNCWCQSRSAADQLHHPSTVKVFFANPVHIILYSASHREASHESLEQYHRNVQRML